MKELHSRNTMFQNKSQLSLPFYEPFQLVYLVSFLFRKGKITLPVCLLKKVSISYFEILADE